MACLVSTKYQKSLRGLASSAGSIGSESFDDGGLQSAPSRFEMLNGELYLSARHIRAFTHSVATAEGKNHIEVFVSFKGLLVHECNEHFDAEVGEKNQFILVALNFSVIVPENSVHV